MSDVRLESALARVPCIGCGGLVPDVTGPTHRYLESSPGCWRLYGEILAREYADPAFGALHRLTVDAYSVQHPGRPSPQTIQSVCVHLMGLCLVLEQGIAPGHATRALGAALEPKSRFVWLTPPHSLGGLTVVDVAAAVTPEEHLRMVRTWAEGAWAAWAAHHETVRAWLREAHAPKSRS
jgi:Family of unknown function (DUF5946)